MGVVNTVAASMEEVIRSRGQVVVMSSVYAFMNGMGNIPYAMSKAAVDQLGRALRVELADHGATVLTTYFSFVDTPMIQQALDQDDVLTELFGTMPKPLTERITPGAAAIAIANALEVRAHRVIHPPRWRALAGLRGLVGPAVDAHFASDRRTLDLIAQLDTRGQARADRPGA